MGEGVVIEGHVTAVDMQLRGPVLWRTFFFRRRAVAFVLARGEQLVSGNRQGSRRERKVELDWLHRHRVYVRRGISECLGRTGAKPICCVSTRTRAMM